MSIRFGTQLLSGVLDLPNQTGKSGKYLKTNGTEASWEDVESGGSQLVSFTNPNLTSTEGICTWVVTHNLGNRNVIATVYNNTTGVEPVCSIEHTDNNTLTIKFKTDNDIAENTYSVTINSAQSTTSLVPLPSFPTEDGDYSIKVSIVNGVPTMYWVSSVSIDDTDGDVEDTLEDL